jgi:hypothetical protein
MSFMPVVAMGLSWPRPSDVTDSTLADANLAQM